MDINLFLTRTGGGYATTPVHDAFPDDGHARPTQAKAPGEVPGPCNVAATTLGDKLRPAADNSHRREMSLRLFYEPDLNRRTGPSRRKSNVWLFLTNSAHLASTSGEPALF